MTQSTASQVTPNARRISLPALRLAKSSRWAHWIGRVLLVLLVVGIGFVIVAPWQQTVAGKGSVIAFAQPDREQVIQAPIKGRIVSWGEGIQENAHVRQGQLIAQIEDLDANYLDRLKDQLDRRTTRWRPRGANFKQLSDKENRRKMSCAPMSGRST